MTVDDCFEQSLTVHHLDLGHFVQTITWLPYLAESVGSIWFTWKVWGLKCSVQPRLLWHLIRGFQTLFFYSFQTSKKIDVCTDTSFWANFLICFIQFAVEVLAESTKLWSKYTLFYLLALYCSIVFLVLFLFVICNQVVKLWPTPTAKFTSWHSIWLYNYGWCSHQLAWLHLDALRYCNG